MNVPHQSKSVVALMALAVVAASCGATSPSAQGTDGAEGTSEWPLRRDDPRARLSIDPAKYPPEKGGARSLQGESSTRERDTRLVTHFPDGRADVVMDVAPEATSPPASTGVARRVDIGEAARPQYAFSPDSRLYQSDTTQYPYSATVKIFVSYSSGTQAGCTGWLVGPRAIVTAGHCLYNTVETGHNGWVTSVIVAAGLDYQYVPFGEAHGQNWAVTSCHITNQDDTWCDKGIVILDRQIGNLTGTYPVAAYSTLYNTSFVVSAYGDDRPSASPTLNRSQVMYTEGNHAFAWSNGSGAVAYDGTYSGNSGAAARLLNGYVPAIDVSEHSDGSAPNTYSMITQTDINNWVAYENQNWGAPLPLGESGPWLDTGVSSRSKLATVVSGNYLYMFAIGEDKRTLWFKTRNCYSSDPSGSFIIPVTARGRASTTIRPKLRPLRTPTEVYGSQRARPTATCG